MIFEVNTLQLTARRAFNREGSGGSLTGSRHSERRLCPEGGDGKMVNSVIFHVTASQKELPCVSTLSLLGLLR